MSYIYFLFAHLSICVIIPVMQIKITFIQQKCKNTCRGCKYLFELYELIRIFELDREKKTMLNIYGFNTSRHKLLWS